MKNKILIIRIIISLILWIFGIIFISNNILSLILFICSYVIVGYDIILGALRNIKNGSFMDEFFLMSIASIGAFILKENIEACAVVIFFQIGEVFQGISVEKSRIAIMKTMDLKPHICHLANNVDVNPDDVKIDDVIVVRPGEMIPLDGIALNEGVINAASLTGESLDFDVSPNEEILSGCINTKNPIMIKVTKEYYDSTAFKIIDMIENATMRKSKSEKIITKFAKFYTPIVVALALILAFIPPLFLGFSETFKIWCYRALSFLVVSCPCALVISVPLSYFAGIGANAKHKIIIKGGSTLEDLALCDTVILDKTGTLTKGEFEVCNIIGEKEEIIKIAKGLEKYSNHPLASAINKIEGDAYEFQVEETPGFGIVGYKDEIRYICGSGKLLLKFNIEPQKLDVAGSVLFIAKGQECIGAIVLEDMIKSEAYDVINRLRRLKKKIMVLSGDTYNSVSSVCNKLGIQNFQHSLLPCDKLNITEEVISKNDGKVVFVGDGINDAPVLAISDVGVSMGQIGSDAAVEASDVVILNDNLIGLYNMLDIAKKTRRIVFENIIFSIVIKIVVLILSTFGILGLEWAIFADVGVCVIAIFNAMRALKIRKVKKN